MKVRPPRARSERLVDSRTVTESGEAEEESAERVEKATFSMMVKESIRAFFTTPSATYAK